LMVWDGSAWQQALAESSANPNLRAAIYDGATKVEITTGGASDTRGALSALMAETYNMGFDGSRWNRWRNNTEVTVVASGTRTASGTSADQTNFNARGVIIFLYVYAVSGSFAAGEGLKLHAEMKDATSGAYHWITSEIGPYTTPGGWQILVYPGAPDTGGHFEVENDVPLPRTWRVKWSITGTNPSFTFSIGASYIV